MRQSLNKDYKVFLKLTKLPWNPWSIVFILFFFYFKYYYMLFTLSPSMNHCLVMYSFTSLFSTYSIQISIQIQHGRLTSFSIVLCISSKPSLRLNSNLRASDSYVLHLFYLENAHPFFSLFFPSTMREIRKRLLYFVCTTSVLSKMTNLQHSLSKKLPRNRPF